MEAKFLWVHRFSEFHVVGIHIMINIDRKRFMLKPGLEVDKYRIYICAILIAINFALSSLYATTVQITILAIICIFLINSLNLIFEFQLYRLSCRVFTQTRGTIPLGKRYEVTLSFRMIKCFLPASVTSLFLKTLTFGFFFVLAIPSVYFNIDAPKFYFILNTIWNLDCTIFPWFFIARVKHRKIVDSIHSQTQNEYFESLKNAWK